MTFSSRFKTLLIIFLHFLSSFPLISRDLMGKGFAKSIVIENNCIQQWTTLLMLRIQSLFNLPFLNKNTRNNLHFFASALYIFLQTSNKVVCKNKLPSTYQQSNFWMLFLTFIFLYPTLTWNFLACLIELLTNLVSFAHGKGSIRR